MAGEGKTQLGSARSWRRANETRSVIEILLTSRPGGSLLSLIFAQIAQQQDLQLRHFTLGGGQRLTKALILTQDYRMRVQQYLVRRGNSEVSLYAVS